MRELFHLATTGAPKTCWASRESASSSRMQSVLLRSDQQAHERPSHARRTKTTPKVRHVESGNRVQELPYFLVKLARKLIAKFDADQDKPY